MQLRIPVDETAIRDTMRAVFSQAAYTKRQPGWLARKFAEVWDWIARHWPFKGSTRESDPVLYWTAIAVLAAFLIAIMVLYYDQRVRKEGYDLQMMSDGLTPAPAPAAPRPPSPPPGGAPPTSYRIR